MSLSRSSLLFYTSLPLLHAFGAILAAAISFLCDTGKGRQVARIPYRVDNAPMTSLYSSSRERLFRAAYPWAEDGELVGNEWNPFALIFVFEWLTAAFALRPLATLQFTSRPDRVLWAWLIWLAAGLAVFITWTATNSGGPNVLMLVTVLVSFLVCAALGYFTLAPDITADPPPEAPAPKKNAAKDPQGRIWSIPITVAGLRARKDGPPYHNYSRLSAGENGITPLTLQELKTQEYTTGVVLRYAEYCVTAPLLFLAVVCLIVPDPPAWLFITGYWLVLICNAIGITLHASFTADEMHGPQSVGEAGMLVGGLIKTFFAYPW